MHKEYSMLNQIFKECLKVARSNNISCISEVNIEVGDFASIAEEFAQQAFKSLKKDTIAENAVLNIKRTPGILHCNSCNQKSEIWFDKEKEKAATEGRLEEYEQYEKTIKEQSLLLDNSNLETNLLYCRKCDSSNTNLIEGMGVLIKNIRI
jgi:hydrogenase nickel incorporation protein HypA/HybF